MIFLFLWVVEVLLCFVKTMPQATVVSNTDIAVTKMPKRLIKFNNCDVIRMSKHARMYMRNMTVTHYCPAHVKAWDRQTDRWIDKWTNQKHAQNCSSLRHHYNYMKKKKTKFNVPVIKSWTHFEHNSWSWTQLHANAKFSFFQAISTRVYLRKV